MEPGHLGVVRLDSPLAEIALLPGVDPRRCLKGPILPKGISNLRIMDILNLFLEGVVEQLQKPDDATTATPTTVSASSSGRSSSSVSQAPARPKAKPRAARSASPPQPKAKAELGRRRPHAQEKMSSERQELARAEAEVKELRAHVARLSRQNQHLLLQLRQQRLQHQQELRLCRADLCKEPGATEVDLLTYLQEAPQQKDQQLEEDLATHSADVRMCLKRLLRDVLQQFGRERASASALEGLQIHVQELWSLLHGLWSSDSLEEIVEDLFKGTSQDVEWPEVAENAEKQALQMIERLSRDALPSSDLRGKAYHVAEPPPREALSESPAEALRQRRSGDVHTLSTEKLRTPSFGSPGVRPSRSPSPSDTRVRPAPNVPAVLMAGPVLSRAPRVAKPVEKPRIRSPEPSLSPRVPTKRNEVRPRSLSPEMAKRLQQPRFR